MLLSDLDHLSEESTDSKKQQHMNDLPSSFVCPGMED